MRGREEMAVHPAFRVENGRRYRMEAERVGGRVRLRIDGNLQHWYTQEGTKPESVIAVVKDRSRGVDRFEPGDAGPGTDARSTTTALLWVHPGTKNVKLIRSHKPGR